MNAAQKLENPERLRELRPEETLKNIGLENGQVLCDIGAGSGIFTLPAAQITSGPVYALDVREDFLQLIQEKAQALGLNNIHTVQVEGTAFDLPDCTADIVLMVTVLHEIPDKPAFLQEIYHILKKNGKAALIEFHPRRTPMGPPPERRMQQEEVETLFSSAGFKPEEEFDLGENFYCKVFLK